MISISPVVCSSHAIFANEEVLGVVYVLVRTSLDSIDDLDIAELALAHPIGAPAYMVDTHTRFQVDQDRSGDISRVIRLVEKYILPVTALCRELFQVAILTYAMFLAELLPELTSNYIIFSCQNATERLKEYMWGLGLTAVAALACLNRDDFSGF